MGEQRRGGGCCPPMDLMGSEPIQLVQLIIPVELANLSISYIGDIGLIQFKDFDEQLNTKNAIKYADVQPAQSNSTGVNSPHKIIHDSSNDRLHGADAAFEESESLSDIDDTEVICYLNNEEEKNLKTVIWE